MALKRCYTCVKAVASGCSPLWFLSSISWLLIGLKCCSHDRLGVKEPTTLEAKKGQYKKEYVEEHSYPWRFVHMRFFVLHERLKVPPLIVEEGSCFSYFYARQNGLEGCSYGNCEGNSYPGVPQVRFVR